MISDEISAVIWECSKTFSLDEKLIKAVVLAESEGQPFKNRHEKNWTYFKDVDIWAQKRCVTEITERMNQMSSWGLMQVMGSVARELGFDRDLPELCIPQVGVYFGSMKLRKLSDKYHNPYDMIASYNAGRPVLTSVGHYKNQSYVDKVCSLMREIEMGGLK